jgi:hypothetical protein
VRQNIKDFDTEAVIDHIVAQEPNDKRSHTWVGSTWDIKSDDAISLLGIPNNAGVSWLLIQYMRQFVS